MTLTKVCNKMMEKAKKRGERGERLYGNLVEEKLKDLRSGIRGGKVISIKCLQARREGEKVHSLSVLLDFQELPDKVRVGYKLQCKRV